MKFLLNKCCVEPIVGLIVLVPFLEYHIFFQLNFKSYFPVACSLPHSYHIRGKSTNWWTCPEYGTANVLVWYGFALTYFSKI